MLTTTPIAAPLPPLPIRLMRAIEACTSMVADVPTVDADWLLTQVAREYVVDRERLALMLLQRMFARDAARLALASTVQGDEEAER